MALQKILKFTPAEEILFVEEALRREGRVEGSLGVVSKPLTQRFGPLPLDVTTHLQSASEAELEEMALRILSAKTLDEVLGKPKRKRR